MLRVNLEAAEAHARFSAGARIAALLFVAAPGLDEAEVLASSELGRKGWARMEIVRSKEITDYAQFEGRDDVVGQVFRDAQVLGFGVVLYPEPGT